MNIISSFAFFLPFLFTSFAFSTESQPEAAPIKGEVFFENIKDGAVVKSPFKVKMAVKGLKVRIAGEDPADKASGHHHVLVNLGPIAKGKVIPADENHIHFGKGQTEAELTLKPGDYTLTLQFADGAHQSYGPELSKTIKVKVTR